MLEIIEALKHIQCDRSVLHILADEVPDVLTRRRVYVLVACSLVDVLAKRISQLDIEAAAQGMALRGSLFTDQFCALWQ